MTELIIFDLPIPTWSVIALVTCLSLSVMLLVKRLIFSRLRRLGKKTTIAAASTVVFAIDNPLNFIILAINLFIAQTLIAFYDLGSAKLDAAIVTALRIILIVAVLVFIERLLNNLISRYANTSENLRTSGSILRGVIRGIVIGLGALILMSTLGISITPLIASLGITSLAVALALQPTLENFFSGVQLIIDKPIRVGDFIELESGEQGFVDKIGWRSTWIKMLPNNIVIIPNSLLSRSKIINYYYPEKELSVPVEVGVHYNSDLEEVERITLEVARQILSTHKWGVPEYDTFVVFHTFDSSSINFTVMLRTREYFNRFFIKSEFIKALHKRYAEEGITIPYPIRAINTTQENSRFEIAQAADY